MTVLVLDNYDSFTYNLVQYLGELGAEVDVVRNDKAGVAELLSRGHDRLGAQLTQVLDEVVGERVVVVDDEDLHAQSACLAASSIARTTPRAFARDSSYS